MSTITSPAYVAHRIRHLKAQIARLDTFKKACTPRQKLTADNIRRTATAHLQFYEDMAALMREFPERYGPSAA